MNNERALAVFDRIASSTSSERLQAARFLAQNATRAHRNQLSKIRQAERNSWVQRALDQALRRSEPGESNIPIVAEEAFQADHSDHRIYEEIRAQVTEETTALFLHELRPLVGFIDAHAALEIEGYEASRTKVSVDRVRSFLLAIERLRQASAAPAMQEFDLTDLVLRVAENEAQRGRAILDSPEQRSDIDAAAEFDTELEPQQPAIKLSPARRDPVVTAGDPALVELALANALRNAIEAVLELQETYPNDIVINWGTTDTDSWIVVLDQGCGLPDGWDRLFEPGTTTKPTNEGHLGMGVPIAKRAVESMRGTFQLTPRSGMGVSCEIRWPHEGNTL